MRSKFVVYTPFTGLGLYGGFRGNRWLRNRIKIFKQFVVPSLINQSDKEFVHWISWRPEERNNPHVKELYSWLSLNVNYPFVFTYEGIAFWDDKYPDEIARERLFESLRNSLPALLEPLSDCEEVIMLLQPSDDLYAYNTIHEMKNTFNVYPSIQAVSYQCGYICNYNTKEVLYYNPNTNPPFFAIKFPRNTFFDPGKHINYTGPYKSHEYVGDVLSLLTLPSRGFMVGTHGENISTHFNHPFGSPLPSTLDKDRILFHFGVLAVPKLELPKSFRKWIIRHLPYKWQKKFRYWWGERLFNWFYNFIRN